MPNSEKIETLISSEALKQFELLKPAVDANVASFEKLVAKAVELNKTLGNAGTFKEINKATKELEENDTELINAQSELVKSQERLKKANKDLGDSFANVGNKVSGISGSTENAFEKLIKLSDALKAIKNTQKELQGQKDTFAQMNQSLPDVQQGLQQILNREKELKAEEILLKKSITDTNKEIKQRLNLSLVTPGTRDEIKTTINALKELRDFDININTDEGKAQIAEINQEIDRLSKVMEQTTDKLEKRKINIGNYPGAVKILQESLKDVNKKIDDFTKSGNQNNDMLQALVKEQTLLQTLVDTQADGFKNATAAIKGNQNAIELLTQVYGEDSEVVRNLIAETGNLKDEVGDLRAKIKAQSSDTKVFDGLLDAAQTLAGVYGIAQGAAALFGEENEELQKTMVKLQAITAILSGLQGIQNALQKESAVRMLITNGLQKIQLAQKYLETAAESKNIVVKYVALAAQKALNVATSAAGGPILILIGLLASAFVSMAAYGDAAEDAAKKNERLSKSLERTNKAIDASDKTIKAKGDKTIADLENNFATEEQLRSAREKNVQAEIDNLKKFNDIDAKNREDAIKNVQRLTSGKVKQDKEAIDEAIKVRDGYLANLQKVTDKENELEILRLNNSRTAKEEVIEANQNEIEAQKTQLQTRLQLQQNIAGNERKTQKERIDALKESRRLQEQIINKEANSKRLDPTLTPSQIKVIESQRTAALTQARRESNKAVEDLNRSYAERERKARFDIIKTEIEDQIKAADLIVANEKSTFDQRTDALYDGLQKRRAIIIAQHDFDIQNDTLTAEERIAIEKKYISDINGLTVEYGLQQAAIYQQNTDKVNEIIEKNLQGRIDKISSGAAKEKAELIKQLAEGQISLEEFNRKTEKAERDARIQTIQQEINDLTAKKIRLISLKQEESNEFLAIQKQLDEKQEQLRNESYAKEIAAVIKLNDLKKQLAVESVETFNSLVNSQFDNEANKVRQAMDDLDKQTAKEKEVAEATIANKQERELAIAKIEAKAQAQREQLEKRQKQIALDRARFEKASNIAQIISTTAIAVIKAFKDYAGPQAFPIAAAIGAIGALQLARAIAAPLPQFEHGTTDAPGGLALVSEKRPELVITPQGQVMQTPAVPTVMNIPKHSIVLPDARAALESGLAVNRQGRLVQQDNGDIKEVGRKIDTLTKVMRNKPVLNMSADQGGLTAMWKYGANWVTYADDQVRF